MSVLVSGVTKSYGAVQVLRGVDLTVRAGELIALFGASGSGKTTLLNLIGALDVPTAGSITINGEEITRLSERRRIQFRRQQIGFIFQNYTLMPTYTAAKHRSAAAFARHRLRRAPPAHGSRPRLSRLERVGRSSSCRTFRRAAAAHRDCAGFSRSTTADPR